MQLSKTILWMSLSVATLGILGCDLALTERSRPERVYVQEQPRYVQPQPVYAEPQPVYAQPQPVYVEPEPQYIIVQQAPPPIIVERRPAPPSSAHIWIEGSWNWNNSRYVWVAGRYEVPPQADAVWVAPRYESDARGYRYTPGQWKKKGNNGRGNGNGRGNDNGRGRGN